MMFEDYGLFDCLF